MPDEITPDVPVVETPVVEDKKPISKIDSSRSLTSQVDKLLKSVPEAAEVDTDAKLVETPIVEDIPEEVELEDIPEETKLDPLPEWSKYVLDKLPNIQVRGHQGEEGKEKIFNVKRLEELPDDFEFESKRAELAFTQALSAQEINARDLLSEYRQKESQRSQQEFEALEAVDIQNDVTTLQKAGLLEKFKYPVNDPRFNDDPAVKESNKIYDYYVELNKNYYDKYNNSGRMYRVSYEDAAYRYYATHPKDVTPKVEKAIEKVEDKQPKTPVQVQREKVAAQVGAPQGAPIEGRHRPLPAGTSMDRIYQAYKQGRI